MCYGPHPILSHPASALSRHSVLWPREVTRSPWLVSCHIDMALDTKSQRLPGAAMEIVLRPSLGGHGVFPAMSGYQGGCVVKASCYLTEPQAHF